MYSEKGIELLFKQFESITIDIGGKDYWSARELKILLEYFEWESFFKSIEAAKTLCKDNNKIVSKNFINVNKIIEIDKNKKGNVNDVFLTRYACSLVFDILDSNNNIKVMFAKAYFTVKMLGKYKNFSQYQRHEKFKIQNMTI